MPIPTSSCQCIAALVRSEPSAARHRDSCRQPHATGAPPAACSCRRASNTGGPALGVGVSARQLGSVQSNTGCRAPPATRRAGDAGFAAPRSGSIAALHTAWGFPAHRGRLCVWQRPVPLLPTLEASHARSDSGFGFWRSREPTMARLTPLPVRPSLLLGSLLSSWASLDWACLTLYSFLAAACSGADADACADHEMSRIEMTVSKTFDLDGRSARLEEHGGRHTAPDIAKHTITARLACAPSPQAARPLVSVSSRLLALHR